MKNILINTLSQKGYIMLSKEIIKKYGLDTAVVLAFLVDRANELGSNEFYYTIEELRQDTTYGEHKIRAILTQLIKLNFLIKTHFKGLPPKQYYKINFDKFMELKK